ncbi:MAG: alpha/beta hydrolase [Clostridia bacterium]|nr:alpha/beta hydrolase [Clostridia bacterium]
MADDYLHASDDGELEEMQPEQGKKHKHSGKAIAAAVALTAFGFVSAAGSVLAYDSLFKRYERPDYRVTPGLRCYERVENRLMRTEVPFWSDNVKLAGYYYPAENAKGLVVFAHGLHAGADDYLAVFEFMVNHGYSVFAFDTKGTYSSEGDSTVGLAEAFVDMDHALDFIAQQPCFRDTPIFVMGHSCGAYAATAVLARHPEVRGSVAIAPMNNASSMINQKGKTYSLPLAFLGIPPGLLTGTTMATIDATQAKRLGKYTKYTAVDAINGSAVPVLIAQGAKDAVVEAITPVSLYFHRNRVRDDTVIWYLESGENGGHDTIWHSVDAVRYQKQVRADLKAMKQARGDAWTLEDEIAFYETVDNDRYSAVNETLFNAAVRLFDCALGLDADNT